MNMWISIFVMALFTYLVRMVPLTFITKKMTNPFLCSFFYYVPYVTLAVMTMPAIMQGHPVAGLGALIFGIIAAWRGLKLVTVAVICCTSVLIINFLSI